MQLTKMVAKAAFLSIGILSLAGNAGAAPITGGTGPGGFTYANNSSTLRLWLDASQGVQTDVSPLTVFQWDDQSGYGAHATQSSGGSKPTFVTNELNGQPVVRFDGSDVLNTTAPNSGTISVLVAYANRTNSGVNGDGSFYSTPHGNDPIQRDTQIFPDSAAVVFAINPGLNANNLLTTRSNYITDNYSAHVNGTFAGSTTNPGNFNSGNLFIGARGGNSEFLDGDIAELVVFHEVLSNSQRLVAENALSARYAINIGTANRYSGDTLHGYRSQVFGVGRVAAGDELLSAGNAGFGIEVVGGALQNDSFVMAGHNQVTNTVSNDGQWSRAWYVDTNGGVTSADITFHFDFDDAGLVFDSSNNIFNLLYSSTEGGPFSILQTSNSPVGDRVAFNFAAGTLATGFYTLSSLTVTIPEPSTFVLLSLGCLGCVVTRRRANRKAA